MAENLIVPRVYRPVAFEENLQERVGEFVWDIAGLQADFSAEGVGTHDAVILGTGEMVWFHRRLGGLLNKYSSDEVCATVSEEMPQSFGQPLDDVPVNKFKIRMEKGKGNVTRNYLVGSVNSWQCISERRYALNAVGKLMGRPAVGLNRDKCHMPKIKLAELPLSHIPEDFAEVFSKRIGDVLVSMMAGSVVPTTVEDFKRSA